MQPVKRGAEAEIYVVEWQDKKAVAKVREYKPYRHRTLDDLVRRRRTIHEANLMSAAKAAGVQTPFIYFVDPVKGEIIMEFVSGKVVKDILDSGLCRRMGRYTALLHKVGIIHGDLTTSNFIVDGKRLVLLDFGLAYRSERIEDMAVDLRLIKEVFTSAHISLKEAFSSFVKGYAGIAGQRRTTKILQNVKEIEQRGRYARVA